MGMGHVHIAEKVNFHVKVCFDGNAARWISGKGEFPRLFWWKWGMYVFQKKVNCQICFHGNEECLQCRKGQFPRVL